MSEKLKIKGGNALKGEVLISGAKNAVLKLMAAALLVKDSDAVDELLSTALALLQSPDRIKQLEKNAGKMALRNAAQVICDEVYKLV